MGLNIIFRSLFKPRNTQFIRYLSDEYTPKALRSLKAKSTRDNVQYYVDSCRVRTVAGNGGDGCISFLSAWCKDHAGPDGGDGGHGGHVIFQATHTVNSLNHCKAVMMAKNGERGFNKDCNGKNAEHVIIPVPLGTIVKDSDGRVVGDLSEEGVMFVAARGGAGGRGNKFFLTDTQQAPDVAELGAIGESVTYHLEVRSMAHIGLLGFPNAGKSTLLRAITRARPKVAPYAFTTVRPHIGMIPYDDYEQVAIADLPGLIPGSHKNHGLGIQFLQHVERCRGLIYLLDGANDPLNQYENLSYELSQYNVNLTKRPYCIVVNKIDLDEGKRGLDEVMRGLDGMKGGLDGVKGGLDGVKGGLGEMKRGLDGIKGVLDLDKRGLGERKGGLRENLRAPGGLSENDFGDGEISKECSDSVDDVNRGARKVRGLSEVGNGGNSELKSSDEVNNVNSELTQVNLEPFILGVSAKTGMNLGELLKVIRQMYDSHSDGKLNS